MPAPTRLASAPGRWQGGRGGAHPPARPVSPSGSAAVYRPRNPTATPLYPIVQHHLETFLARAPEADPLGDGVPFWVENDFRAYLRCGILAHGFARARCQGCGRERLVAFSCKGRGVCPSCNARRMVEVAAHLTDHVLPPLALRQWVFSLPKRLRPFLYRDPELAGAVLRILLRAVRSTLHRTSPGAPDHAQLGAISFLHRFGSSLNPHFHFHVVVFDGLLSKDDDGSLRFHEATRFTAQDAERLQRTLQRRVLSHFVRRGLLDDHVAHNMLAWQAAGGFSLDASVRIEGSDRPGRERLLRYCARPPFALERLDAQLAPATGEKEVRRVIYRLPRATPDGRIVLALSPLEFLEALARLLPPPRVHRQRYHGVLAANARLRTRLTAWAREATLEETGQAADAPAALAPSRDPRPAAGVSTSHPGRAAPAHHSATATPSAARSRWARLLARVYEVFPLLCPDCGAQLRILAFLTQPEPVHAILHHLGLPTRPPPLSPARGPPELELDFDAELDQTPAFDPADPEPIPDFNFDQSRGG